MISITQITVIMSELRLKVRIKLFIDNQLLVIKNCETIHVCKFQPLLELIIN